MQIWDDVTSFTPTSLPTQMDVQVSIERLFMMVITRYENVDETANASRVLVTLLFCVQQVQLLHSCIFETLLTPPKQVGGNNIEAHQHQHWS